MLRHGRHVQAFDVFAHPGRVVAVLRHLQGFCNRKTFLRADEGFVDGAIVDQGMGVIGQGVAELGITPRRCWPGRRRGCGGAVRYRSPRRSRERGLDVRTHGERVGEAFRSSAPAARRGGRDRSRCSAADARCRTHSWARLRACYGSPRSMLVALQRVRSSMLARLEREPRRARVCRGELGKPAFSIRRECAGCRPATCRRGPSRTRSTAFVTSASAWLTVSSKLRDACCSLFTAIQAATPRRPPGSPSPRWRRSRRGTASAPSAAGAPPARRRARGRHRRLRRFRR